MQYRSCWTRPNATPQGGGASGDETLENCAPPVWPGEKYAELTTKPRTLLPASCVRVHCTHPASKLEGIRADTSGACQDVANVGSSLTTSGQPRPGVAGIRSRLACRRQGHDCTCCRDTCSSTSEANLPEAKEAESDVRGVCRRRLRRPLEEVCSKYHGVFDGMVGGSVGGWVGCSASRRSVMDARCDSKSLLVGHR